jgi:hypothetical protein
MKTCKRCFREFNEEELPDVRPTNDLADILLQDISGGDVSDLCPECSEELGMVTLLGFGQ